MNSRSVLDGLRLVVDALEKQGQGFALAGGLAVAIRAEPRFTADIDIVVAVGSDAAMESLIYNLRQLDFELIALVELKAQNRLATSRLEAPGGMIVDLIAATCGIEQEIVARATLVEIPEVGKIPVIRAEELLSMKILSMTEKRPLDRVDSINLLCINDNLDISVVRQNLLLIINRGYHRDQDLLLKLETLLAIQANTK